MKHLSYVQHLQGDTAISNSTVECYLLQGMTHDDSLLDIEKKKLKTSVGFGSDFAILKVLFS